jgi:hypothetical protein
MCLAEFGQRYGENESSIRRTALSSMHPEHVWGFLTGGFLKPDTHEHQGTSALSKQKGTLKKKNHEEVDFTIYLKKHIYVRIFIVDSTVSRQKHAPQLSI